MREDRLQNPPAIDPGRTEAERQLLRQYRRQYDLGVPLRKDIPGKRRVQGGTVAVVQTDIRTLGGRTFPGASSKALPEKWRGAPGTTGGKVMRPTNPIADDHAEHVALENLRTAIEEGIARGEIQRSDLNGRTVYM